MAKIPQYEEQAALSAQVDFQIPAGAYQARSFDRVQQALGRWQDRAHKEADARAIEHQQGLATQAQSRAAPGALVEPDASLARPYRDAFRERATLIYEQQQAIAAMRTASGLKREHRFDPDGFARAWGAYVEGQESALAATDPTKAVASRLALEKYGEGVFQELAEAEFVRAQERQTAEATENFRVQLAAWSDEVKASGLEADYYEGLFQMDASLDALLDTGVISAEQHDTLRTNALQGLTTDMLYGRFRNSLKAEDIGGAESVIVSLREGKWFRHNPHGEKLANTLESELLAFLKGAEGDLENSVGLALYRLQRHTAAKLSGLAVDDDAIASDIAFVEQHGNPKQIYQAGEYAATQPMAAALGGKVQTIPLAALPDVQDTIHRLQLALTPEAKSALEASLKQHRDDLERGLTGGDLLPPSMEFQSLGAVTPEQARSRQAQRAALYGFSPNDVPLWGVSEERRFAAQMDSALKEQRFDEADILVSAFVGAYGDDLRGVAQGALALGETAPAMYFPALLHALDEGSDLASDAMALVGLGRRADRSALLKKHGADLDDLRRDRELARRISAAAMGDSAVMEDLYRFFDDVYVGVLAQDPEARGTGARDAAMREVRRLLSPVGKTVEFANGARLPDMFVAGDAVSAQEAVAEVNRHLENPRLFDAGVDFQMTEDFTRNLAIKPAPGGGLGFWHNTQGRFITDRDGAIVSVSRPSARSDAPDPGLLLGSLQSGLEWAGTQAEHAKRSLASTKMRDAALALGTDAPLLEGIFYAVQDTPPEELGWRPRLGLPRDIDLQADWKALRPHMTDKLRGFDPAWQTVDHAAAQPLLAAQHLQRMRDAFPDDEKAQLAAYFDSPALVRALQKEHGPMWFTELPMATQAFVIRAERYATRRRQ